MKKIIFLLLLIFSWSSFAICFNNMTPAKVVVAVGFWSVCYGHTLQPQASSCYEPNKYCTNHKPNIQLTVEIPEDGELYCGGALTDPHGVVYVTTQGSGQKVIYNCIFCLNGTCTTTQATPG